MLSWFNYFQGLDFVVAEAKKYGIHLILSLVNNFKDYGGRAKYVQWAKQQGQNVTNEDDFYTNSIVKEYYKNHVEVRWYTAFDFLELVLIS